MEKKKTYILALDIDDAKSELDFEIDFQFSLSPEERYDIMDAMVNDGLEQEERNGYKNTPAIVVRT